MTDKKQTPKQVAQAAILSCAQVVFDAYHSESMSKREKEQLDKQFRRIEKMFGYIEGSWHRGS